MKRIGFSLLALLMLVSVGMTKAQDKSILGVKAGANLNSISANFDDVNFDNKTGYHVGLFYTMEWNKFRLQPALMFEQRGGEFSADDISVKETFNYFMVPIEVSYKLVDLNGVALRVNVAPRFGLLINAVEEFDGRDDYYKVGLDKDEDQLSALDFGVQLGASIQFGRFEPYAGYDLGLVDIAYGDVRYRNRSIFFGLAFHL